MEGAAAMVESHVSMQGISGGGWSVGGQILFGGGSAVGSGGMVLDCWSEVVTNGVVGVVTLGWKMSDGGGGILRFQLVQMPEASSVG
jgi:hypothetical protein